jgi:predicted membrane GTPase involved in stress response
MEEGTTTGYALMDIQERGALFIGVGEEAYEGECTSVCGA